MNRYLRLPAAMLAALMIMALTASVTSAHSHTIGSNGQVIANGQNHYAFFVQADGTFLTCDTFNALANQGPAWYGLETAHHGPDSGDAGRGDGCYAADASPLSEADDVNPAID
ncbi:MAG: hypothetical protein EPO36_02635 [Chloroflexota bacterium]|nr:MAG: hypothetical protein EPO36_02635 [Chloroflexota bacterium]